MKPNPHPDRIQGDIRELPVSLIAPAPPGTWKKDCRKPRWLMALLALCCLTHPLSADQFGNFTYTDDGSSITITDYPIGLAGSVEIPSSIIGKPVTRIGDSAFYYCRLLTAVTIPDSVTSIGTGAFRECANIAGITLPDSVTSIGAYAFAGCESLTSMTIPDSVTSLGQSAFQWCAGLESATIGKGVTSIGWSVFAGCTNLASVTYGDHITSIGGYAFDYCTSLAGITIGGSVTSIGNNAFFGCSSLGSVNIPASVTSLGDKVFSECGNLTEISVESLNPSYTSLAGVLFNKEKTLLIQYPGGKAGDYAVPDSVRTIGASAFVRCVNLVSVTIPDSVNSIDSGAFLYCGGLTSVTLGSCVTTIGNWAFGSCRSLASVTIPDSVTTIGDWAFNYCDGLTSVTIGEGVSIIGESAFGYCSKLVGITIPEGVTSIGSSAFDRCSGLVGITIPDSITSIAPWTFGYCSNLKSVTLGRRVTSIGYAAFSSCGNLTGITIPSSVTSIGDWAFSGCNRLTRVFFPGKAPDAGEDIFGDWTSKAIVYYVKGHAGFTSPTWLGYASVALSPTREISIATSAGTPLKDGVSKVGLGTVAAGGSVVKVITIKNEGATGLIRLAVRKDAAHFNDFIVGKLAGTELPPAGKMTFTVTFRPQVPGVHTTVIHIESNDADENPFDIVLTGTQSRQAEISVQQPVGSQLSDGESSISFGRVMLRSKVGRTFTVRNTGTAVLEGISVTLNGKNPQDFTVASPQKSSLPPGAGTTFRVIFHPSAMGARSALIHIRSNDRDENPFDITLTGEGVKPAPKAAPVDSPLPLCGVLTRPGHRMRTVATTMRIQGKNYRCVTVPRNGAAAPNPAIVEVSSNLVDWFSGDHHTTVVKDTGEVVKVRDNTPIGSGVKRFIRVRTPVSGEEHPR